MRAGFKQINFFLALLNRLHFVNSICIAFIICMNRPSLAFKYSFASVFGGFILVLLSQSPR